MAESGAAQPRKATQLPTIPVVQSVTGTSTYQRRITTCKAELQQLVQQKREQCNAERMAKQMMESAEWESRPPLPGRAVTLFIPLSNDLFLLLCHFMFSMVTDCCISGWHPKGLLVAHLHEHKAAVNRIRVSDEHSIFATCSNDGTVKIWDSQKMEGKTTTTRFVIH